MPNTPQKHSYSFRKRCTTSASPWLMQMMQKCSSSRLFFTLCGGLFRLWINQALSDYKNLLVWDTHITVLLSVPFHRTSLDWKDPVTQSQESSQPPIHHTPRTTHTKKKNYPRASVIFVRKPTWIQSEEMQTTGCLQRYSPSMPRTAQTEDRCLWHLPLPDLFYSSRFKLTYCSHLLRESEKRENLKAGLCALRWDAPRKGPQHLRKSALLMGDRCPQRSAQSHSFPGLKSSTNPQFLSHLLAVRGEEAHRRYRARDGLRKCDAVSQHSLYQPA